MSAEADPQIGVSIYDSGWLTVGGTSAATPLVTAAMAAVGHGDITPDFVYRHPEAFRDVTSGNNGSCGNALCDAGSGWDGPTGLGSPVQTALAAIGGGVGPSIRIDSPVDGASATTGDSIAVTAGDGAFHVDLAIDGVRVQAAGSPFQLQLPDDTATGMHEVTATAYDIDHNSQTTSIKLDISQGGGCSAGGSPVGIVGALAGVAFVTSRRRRRVLSLTLS